jgi:hypothetical protein
MPVSHYISITQQMLKCAKWVVPQELHTEIMYTKLVSHTLSLHVKAIIDHWNYKYEAQANMNYNLFVVQKCSEAH